MASKVIIENNAYHDSVTLMSLSSKINNYDGVEQAVVSMATKMNKDLLEDIGLLTDEAEAATENDLIIALIANTDERVEEVMEVIHEELTSKKTKKGKGKEVTAKSVHSALNAMPDANMAIISVPGEYAAREARQALKKGVHVMLFSDNVSIEDEKALKEMGRENDLFVMGPDCGTAIINNGGLCFANKVSEGGIGLVAASGTGLQEVTVQIDRLGYGITQAIGTGGRDLHESIGGMMMLQGLKALENDDKTKVITLISKPPAPSVQDKIVKEVSQCKKPVVVCFLDGDAQAVEAAGATFSATLIDAARKSVALLDPEVKIDTEMNERVTAWVEAEKGKFSDSQQDIRGLFCGGTLTSEALSIIRSTGESVKSNVAKKAEEKVADITESVGHTLLDMGDDEFTKGKPHPMIEPTLRNERIIQEAKDPRTAVLLLDFELGYGSNDDPAGVTLDALKEAKDQAEQAGRHLSIVSYICGTSKDKQDYKQQQKKLQSAGVYVADSNEMATRIATMLVQKEVN
ncbi:acyl-CoA synthetase FdrA [Lentibacillus cibarius]|uniref:Acyl-CoA synthetase FdrA n=1 Tax=Lentibacillus cibarius TaxID=2583219 RepID=A0A549YGC1_9BACI|nr:acyl-CoA synthetase FdrA [Lentibacillus cibarius]TMN22123.1 acyl-CoA synthetase FdrA [Lentibacillus cibarius]TRM10898.1 acyl-CoA synthetase FdrA [Lentibacillus cibarius]